MSDFLTYRITEPDGTVHEFRSYAEAVEDAAERWAEYIAPEEKRSQLRAITKDDQRYTVRVQILDEPYEDCDEYVTLTQRMRFTYVVLS